jgi:hypothetical protein
VIPLSEARRLKRLKAQAREVRKFTEAILPAIPAQETWLQSKAEFRFIACRLGIIKQRTVDDSHAAEIGRLEVARNAILKDYPRIEDCFSPLDLVGTVREL